MHVKTRLVLGGQPADERRMHYRVDADIPCSLRFATTEVAARLRDLSLGGALLALSPVAVRPGDEVQVTCDTPIRIKLVATVANVGTEGWNMRLGVAWKGVSPEDTKSLSTSLAQLVGAADASRGQSPRIAARFPARIVSSHGAEAVIENASRGGAFLRTLVALRLSDEVVLDLTVQGGAPLRLRAHVRQLTQAGGESRVDLTWHAHDTVVVEQLLLRLLAL
jgi:hypothetical protein